MFDPRTQPARVGTGFGSAVRVEPPRLNALTGTLPRSPQSPTLPRSASGMSPTRRLSRHSAFSSAGADLRFDPCTSVGASVWSLSLPLPPYLVVDGLCHSVGCVVAPTPYAQQERSRDSHLCFCSHGPAFTIGQRYRGTRAVIPCVLSVLLPAASVSYRYVFRCAVLCRSRARGTCPRSLLTVHCAFTPA